MNFIKNTWKSLFKAEITDDKKQNKMMNECDEEIPMEVLQELFELSANFLKQSKTEFANEDKLTIYGLFKQATVGDCNTEKPQIFDLVGKAKWESWNNMKGMSKKSAMGNYIFKANEIDPVISKKINKKLCPEQNEGQIMEETGKAHNQGTGYKKVQQVDYSDEYSHPYFKPIIKQQPIPQINHDLLMQKNNSPQVYPLHFAIEKQRVDLIPRFLQLLTVEQITSMTDPDGTGILEYAQLMENDEILQMIEQKLGKK